MVANPDDLASFADQRLLPLLQQFVDVQVHQATWPLENEIKYLRARIAMLEREAA